MRYSEVEHGFWEGKATETSELWVPGWPHEAPDEPFSVSAARHVMQVHRGCDRFDCARKMAAWNVLVQARIVVPDSGRGY